MRPWRPQSPPRAGVNPMPRTPGSVGRAGLSRDAVLAAAATLADEHGIEAVTLAKLADSLGIRTPSLYNHIASLDDLRRGLALVAVRDLTARLSERTGDGAGSDRLLSLANAYRTYAKDHPGLYAAFSRGASPDDDPQLSAASRALVEFVVRALPGTWDDERASIHAVRSLRSLLHGFVALETTGGFGLPVDIDASFAVAVEIFANGLRTTAASRRPSLSAKDERHGGTG